MFTCTRLHSESVYTPARQHPRSSPQAHNPPLHQPPPPPSRLLLFSSCLPLLRLMTQRAAPCRVVWGRLNLEHSRGVAALWHTAAAIPFFVLHFGSLLLVEPPRISTTFADRRPSFRRADATQIHSRAPTSWIGRRAAAHVFKQQLASAKYSTAFCRRSLSQNSFFLMAVLW